MKKSLELVENDKGNFNIRDFGTHIAGLDGTEAFDLVVKSSDRQIDIRIANVTILELFSRFDTKGEHFRSGVYFSIDFVEIAKRQSQICLVVTKTVFTLFKSASSSGRLISNCALPLTVTDGTKIAKYSNTKKRAAA